MLSISNSKPAKNNYQYALQADFQFATNCSNKLTARFPYKYYADFRILHQLLGKNYSNKLIPAREKKRNQRNRRRKCGATQGQGRRYNVARIALTGSVRPATLLGSSIAPESSRAQIARDLSSHPRYFNECRECAYRNNIEATSRPPALADRIYLALGGVVVFLPFLFLLLQLFRDARVFRRRSRARARRVPMLIRD